MKGLLQKDFYMIWSYCRFILIACVIFAIASIFEDSVFFTLYPSLLASMIPINIMTYETHCKWNIYTHSLPVTRKQLVSNKYILVLFGVLATTILTVISQSIRLLAVSQYAVSDFVTVVITVTILAILAPSFLLPFVFKFGTEKGRILYIITFACLVAFTTNFLGNENTLVNISFSPYLLLLLSIIIFVVSWMLSIRFYEKREL